MVRSAKGRRATVELTGVLTPVSWDDEGNVVAVGVATADECDYVIRRGAAMEELTHHLRELVRIRGVLGRAEDGRQAVDVESFEALDRPSSWERWD
ncbi:MAG: hypothetical protein BWZ02_00117 [Lentisphaerae bacterium ADurb.BinA184]|nr:MAG: hypothetical protein BWZ02_00117 [Lentisphaerae bacterium ADurb.BinA184]